MQNEIYLRMLILLLPFMDYHFFDKYDFDYLELERRILTSLKYHGHIDDIDKAKNIIRCYYYKNKYFVNDFFRILEELSNSLLTYHNDSISVDNYTRNSNFNDILYPFHNKVLPFIEINKLISDNLLISIYNYNHNYDLDYVLANNLIRPISVVNFQLNNILDKGLAETHTHLFGSTPFEVQWTWLMDKLENDDYVSAQRLLEVMDKNSSRLNYHKESMMINGYLGEIIIASSVVRGLLMKYASIYKTMNFEDYIKYIIVPSHLDFEEQKYLKKILLNFMHCIFDKNEKNFTLHFKLLRKLSSNGKLFLNGFYESLSLKESQYLMKNSKLREEGQFHIKDYNKIEYIFLYKCFEKYKNNRNDDYFQKFFFQYIRYKNLFHSFINQSSDIKGFFEFQMYFNNQHTMIESSSLMFTPIFQTYAYDEVKYLEIRIGHVADKRNEVSMSDIIKIMKINLLKFINAYTHYLESINTEKCTQAGIIMHFNKREDIFMNFNQYVGPKKCWYGYSKYKDKVLLNYEKYREECFKNLMAIQYLRSNIKYVDKYIIGIDAASNELLTEPWVLAPVFRSVKDRWNDILVDKEKKYDLKINRCFPLGITYHVGEVFNSIVSGLRHVDEVIEYYGFQNGERLGHATILGIDTNTYSRSKKIITLPVIELLDNWLWLYHLKSEQNLFPNVSTLYIEEHIRDLVNLIYSNDRDNTFEEISIHLLYEAYKMQFKETKINLNFFKECNFGEKANPCYFMKDDNKWSSKALFYSRHCQCYLKKMTKMIQVDIDNDWQRQIYVEAQNYLLKKIERKGIIVEVNPISNTNIGNMNTVFEHSISKINDSYKDSKITSHVMTTINTDNPGVFSTTLRNQFGFIEQMLLYQGYSKEQVLKWIDQVRETGVNSTFIREKEKIKKVILNELKTIKEDITKKGI